MKKTILTLSLSLLILLGATQSALATKSDFERGYNAGKNACKTPNQCSCFRHPDGNGYIPLKHDQEIGPETEYHVCEAFIEKAVECN